jgi:hypothetical protein
MATANESQEIHDSPDEWSPEGKQHAFVYMSLSKVLNFTQEMMS